MAAFNHHYASWIGGSGLGNRLSAFVVGSANMIESIGIPAKICMTVMGVFIVSFAATTLDTATRLQRYIVGEICTIMHFKAGAKKHPSTVIAVVTAMILAFYNGSGTGALVLWPLFGATNQLLAGLALLVITIYLARRGTGYLYTMIPMVFMIIMTGWAMIINLDDFYNDGNWLLFCIGLITMLLEIWMIIESIIVMKQIRSKSSK